MKKSSRRNFLRYSSGLVAIGAAPPAFLSRAVAEAKKDDRVLVIVQLAGGNDGLNTVIPFNDDSYKQARPSLAIGPNTTQKLNDQIGLHPQMGGMRELYDEGVLSIIQGVGYPQPDRSHFRSMDIWNSAQPEGEFTGDGWLGRALDQSGARFTGQVPALALGTGNLPLALVAQRTNVPSIQSIDEYKLKFDATQTSILKKLTKQQSTNKDSNLGFLRQTLGTAIGSAERLNEVTASYQTTSPYPQTKLAQNLKTVAQLIAGEMGARIFFVSLGGFDTHARQADSHAALMGELSGAISAFFKDIKGHKLNQQVLLATYSEFGRRLKENASLGTDHGAASNMFIASGAGKGGLIGDYPSLTDLDEGDLKFTTDFRSVYATLLERWLDIPAAPVLGGDFAHLSFLS